MEQGSEPVGSLDDIQQEEEFEPLPIAPVRVRHDGPVQVHAVPSVSGGSRNYAMGADEVKRIGNQDLRRRSLVIVSTVSFFVGAEDNEVRSGYGALWPANVPLTLTHAEQVYVRTSGAGTLSAITETWAS